jgi:hypothetical protein
LTDNFSGNRILNGRYCLSLLDREGGEVCRTVEHYEWPEVIGLSSFFREKSVEMALSWWKKRGL